MAQILSQPPALPAFSFAQASVHKDGFSNMEADSFRLSAEPSQFSSPQASLGAQSPPAFASDSTDDQVSSSAQAGSTTSRHSRKTKSVALPSFDFNPASRATSTAPPILPTRALSSSGNSPSKGMRRHRRINSEFIGDSISQPTPPALNPSPDNAPDEISDQTLPALSSTPSLKRGHRHRRSAALSSQDLSSAARITASEVIREKRTGQLVPSSPKSSATIDQPDLTRSGSLKKFQPSPSVSKTPSPSHISFSEKVDIIPEDAETRAGSQIGTFSRPAQQANHLAMTRPRSADSMSRRRGPSLIPDYAWAKDDLDISRLSKCHSNSPRRNIAPKDSKLSMTNEDKPSGERSPALNWSFPTLEEQSSSNLDEEDDEPVAPRDDKDFQVPTSYGSVRLSGNFDIDPTETVVMEEAKTNMLSAPQVSEQSSKRPITGDHDDAVMDIDAEMQDTSPGHLSHEDSKTLRGKGFSAARKSMHSGASKGGLVGPGTLSPGRTELHRRSESAPSSLVTNSTWSELAKFKDSSASQKGFEMNNVFEEDEDDNSPPPSKHIKGGSSPALDSHRFLGHSGTPTHGGRNKLALAPLRPLETSTACMSRTHPYQRGLYHAETPSTDGACSVSNARHLDLPRGSNSRGPGTNSLPSLIDSQSTVTDGHQRMTPSEASPGFPPPSAHSNSSNRAWADARRKRSSVVSLSKLIGISSAGRSNLSLGQSARCQTSDGLGMKQEKKSKSRRVSSMLKSWKSKYTRKG